MNRIELMLGMLVLSFAWVVLIEGIGDGLAVFLRDWLLAMLQLGLASVGVYTLGGVFGARQGGTARRYEA